MNAYKFANAMPDLGGWIEDVLNQGLGNQKTNHSAKSHQVPVNISQDDSAYILQVIAPGRQREDFSLSVNQKILTIEAKEMETPDEKKWMRQEYHIKAFKRSFTLNEKVDLDNISAKYNNGILEISIAKKMPVEPEVKSITIE